MPENQQFFIRAQRQSEPVSEEVYHTYHHSKRRDRYFEHDLKVGTAIRDKDGNIIGYRPAKEVSLDRLLEAGMEFADESVEVEDTAITNAMIDLLHDALHLLDEKERAFIDALFFYNNGIGMGERECAAQFGLSKTALHARKMKLLAKLRGLIENNLRNS